MPDYTHPHSRTHSAPTASTGAGFDVKTLFLTACASAAAAYASSKLWAPGTLAAAAFTPVLVAILKEALAKPTDAVARAVPVRGVLRSARAQGPQPPDANWSATHGAGGSAGDERAALEPVADPATRVAQPGEIQYHGTGRRMRGWRLAVVTGLLGFLICAVVFTVPELLAGGSASGGGRDTTIFGGGKDDDDRSAPAVTKTTTVKTRTVTPPPATTVKVPPPVTVTTPPPKPAPTTTAPVPAEPAPDPAEPAVPAPPAAQPPG